MTSTSARGARRRESIRDSWLQFGTHLIAVRFVLRCGNVSADLRSSLLAAGDCDCVDHVSAAEGRRRGVIASLVWWFTHALLRFPTAAFVGKADSDAFLHLPDVGEHLKAILSASTRGSYAYYGNIGYYSVVTALDGRLSFHGFGPTFSAARHVFRRRVARSGSCEDGSNNATSRGCTGPFPFAFGPLVALGRGAATALVRSPGLQNELSRLDTVLPDDSGPIATEDVWLGSALWRFLGSSVPLSLYSIAESTTERMPAYLYHDREDFSVRPSLVVYHRSARSKFIGRLRILYLHALRDHCSVAPLWKLLRRQCCGAASSLQASMPAGGPAVDSNQKLNSLPPSWPLHMLDRGYRLTTTCGQREAVDLADASTLRRLGIADKLARGLQGNSTSSYLRPEPGRPWTRIYAWQKESSFHA